MTYVDHIVFAVPDLETGSDQIERLLGVRPVPGGRHPNFGTHNALLSLGPRTYLEVIAPDPTLERPGRGRVFGLDTLGSDAPGPLGSGLGEPGRARLGQGGLEQGWLTTWALGTENIEEASARAHRAHWDPGPIETGKRTRPDGSALTWRLSDPWTDRLGGVVPFLIDWGASPHPASTLPVAGEFVELIIEHPDPEKVLGALAALGICVDVRLAAKPGLITHIRTPKGSVALS